MVKANFAPSGRPWKIEESGKRIKVAANEPPKMTIAAWESANIRRSPPIRMSETSTMAPATRPMPVAKSIDTYPAQIRERAPAKPLAPADDPSLAALKGRLPNA